MHSERTKNEVFKATSHYLQSLAAIEGHVTFSIKDWVFDGSPENSLQQIGNNECGVFMIANLRICAGIEPLRVLQPSDVPRARHQFCLDILHGQVDFPHSSSSSEGAPRPSQMPLAPYSTQLYRPNLSVHSNTTSLGQDPSSSPFTPSQPSELIRSGAPIISIDSSDDDDDAAVMMMLMINEGPQPLYRL